MHRAFIASLSLIALMLAADETFAAPGAAARGGSVSARSMSHPSIAHSFRHHRRHGVGGAFWPGGDFSYGPSNGEPIVDLARPSGENRYTYTYDVPWDWAHRFPPAVTPSDRPYVPNCTDESVTVPGRDAEQTVNVTRCY
jgi:hypothetical protein